jgi:hypothetical protein
MDIVRLPQPITTGLTAPTTAPTPLKLGTVLAAVVQARLSESSFLLQLGPSGRTVIAHSGADLRPGTQLMLEVTRLGPLPELRTVAPGPSAAPANAPAAAGPDSVASQALRQFLPRQIGLAEFAQALPSALNQPAQALPAPVRQALEAVLAALPQPSQWATPEGLARAVRDSGLFFEARLAAAAGHKADFPAGDFKGKLLALLERLKVQDVAAPLAIASNAEAQGNQAAWREVAAELEARADAGPTADLQPDASPMEGLARKVEGALARIGLDQLASLPQADGAQAWRLELPCADGGAAAKLLIAAEDRPGSNGGKPTKSWSLQLELEPPGLGNFCARIVLTSGRIDTYLWSGLAATAGLIQDHSELLRARLEQAGLSVGRLDTLEKPPATAPQNPAPTAPLLDLRA